MPFTFLPLKSIKLTTLAKVMNYQAEHLLVLLLRLPPVSQGHSSNFNSLQNYILHSILNWSQILFLTAASLGAIPDYVQINQSASAIPHFERFLLTAPTTFLFLEYLWFLPFKKMQNSGQYAPLQLIGELKSKLDYEIDPTNQRRLLQWANIVLSSLQAYLRLMQIVFTLHCTYLVHVTLQYHQSDAITIGQCLLFTLMTMYSHYFGALVVKTATTLFVDLLFTVRVFKCKITKCRVLLKWALLTGSELYTKRFMAAYLDVHRQLTAYNVFCSELLFFSDVVIKVAGSIAFSGLFLPGQSTATSNNFYHFVLGLYLISYLVMNLVFTYLAYFPDQNLKTYKAFTRMLATAKCCLVRRSFHKPKTVYMLYLESIHLNRALKYNSMLQFLAKNTFGFTYSSFFKIQKLTIGENIVATVYIFILFCEQFVW